MTPDVSSIHIHNGRIGLDFEAQFRGVVLVQEPSHRRHRFGPVSRVSVRRRTC